MSSYFFAHSALAMGALLLLMDLCSRSSTREDSRIRKVQTQRGCAACQARIMIRIEIRRLLPLSAA